MNNVVSRAEMLIFRSTSEVFNALTQPKILEAFWLKRSSGVLFKDAVIEWEFLVEGARDTLKVTEFVKDKCIEVTFSGNFKVQFEFKKLEGDATKVSVTATGFEGEELTAQAVDATEGFTLVLCDLKIFLETGKVANLVRDKATLISKCMKG